MKTIPEIVIGPLTSILIFQDKTTDLWVASLKEICAQGKTPQAALDSLERTVVLQVELEKELKKEVDEDLQLLANLSQWKLKCQSQ